MKTITVLGSTGSVGRQVLDVIEKHPGSFKVVGLSAYSNDNLLREQLDRFNPLHYYCANGAVEVQSTLFDFLDDEDPSTKKFVSSLEDLAGYPSDIVVVAVSGIAGLWPTVKALKRGATVAIANKETIVCAGRHLKALEKKYGGKILPLDTEHSAIFECLKGENPKSVSKLVLTASGGALRDYPISKLEKVTAEEALRHPVWSMGKKITIDSATLFNKGLEVIEAMNLFGMDLASVEVVMHRESIVHSLVEFKDGSMKGLFSAPDLALAIETALFYPELGNNSVKPINLANIGQLTFSAPDYDRYPCLKIAMDAAKYGEGSCIAICIADEILVDSFLKGKIKYGEIAVILRKVLNKFKNTGKVELDDIMTVADSVTKFTNQILKK